MYEDSYRMGETIKKIGWAIIIIGVICSLILGAVFPAVTVTGTYYTHTEETYNWGLALGGSAASAISGVLTLGLAEIIFLLCGIRRDITKSCDRIIEELKAPDEEK